MPRGPGVKISYSITAEVGHRLFRLPEGHKCRRPHGHSYTITLSCEDDELDEMGMVVDAQRLSACLTYVRAKIDHRMVLDPEDPWFGTLRADRDKDIRDGAITIGSHPTAENIAKWVHRMAKEMKYQNQLPESVSVTVRETSRIAACYP